jgi:hypothetical protein
MVNRRTRAGWDWSSLRPQRLRITEYFDCREQFTVNVVHRCPYVGLYSFELLISTNPV